MLEAVLQQRKRTFVREKIFSRIDTVSGLQIVVDGRLILSGGRAVYVQKTGNTLNFYVRGEKGLKLPLTNMENELLNACCSSQLFGWDFSKWTEQKFEELGEYRVEVFVNPSLKTMFIQSDMYTIVRTSVPKIQDLSKTEFNPTVDEGRQLEPSELIELLELFRLQGFFNQRALGISKLERFTTNYLHPFHKIGDRFFVAHFDLLDTYDPIREDPVVQAQLKGTKVSELLKNSSRQVYGGGTMGVSLATSHEASEVFGTEVHFPFDFNMFYSILAGQLLPPNRAATFFPNKGYQVYMIREVVPDLERVITPDKYELLSSEDKSYYVRSNSMSSYLASRVEFLRRRGYRRISSIFDVSERVGLN